MEEDKVKAFNQVNEAWKLTKPIFDAYCEDAFEKSNMLLQIELSKLQEDERNLLEQITWALWDYLNIKEYKRRKEIK